MSSSKEYLSFVLEQLSLLENISFRSMMGEYIIYYKNKIIGGIYDDRFLVKITKSSAEMLPEALRQLPYEKAKEMLLVDRIDDREFLADLFNAMYDELPERKK
ncbi:MAG: TfoX/Sxy family protein [Ruminococcus sp.]|nr:TfoX/Sxy family protein [Ruminococcus sp.]